MLGFVKDAAGDTSLTAPFAQANETAARGINNVGQVVGYYTDGTGAFYRGYLRDTAGNYTQIVAPYTGGSELTEANGINNHGQIVGWYEDPNGNAHGFLRDANGKFTQINFPGSYYTVAEGINDSGHIVGYYVTPSGIHGFEASPVPEPTSLALLGAGATGLVVVVKRRR
jgi:probable HAF family extracellular repeat protein